jgi:hypothetical protein
MPGVTFALNGTTYCVLPENEAKWRAEADKAAKPYRRRRITAGPRSFPWFQPGMTTGEYIAWFKKHGGAGPLLIGETWPGWNRTAPMLDPSMPECIEWEATDATGSLK